MNNLFENIPKNLEEEALEQLVKSEHISIERIISKGHQSPHSGWYDQDKNEWVIVVSGKAILSFDDGSDITLKKGDYINIPAHKKHKVKWTEPSVETIWLAIFY